MLVLSKCWLLRRPDRPRVSFFFSPSILGMWVRKGAPWCRDPWPSVGDPTRCGVCAGTVARGSSVSRGEALSPQTATESMARGVLSAPLSIILPPCLSLSLLSLPLFPSLTLSFTLFSFCHQSLTFCSTLRFCFCSHFFFFFSPLRYPLFHLGYWLSLFSVAYCTCLQPPPPSLLLLLLLPSLIHTLTFWVWLFFFFLSLSNLFHPCLSSDLAHTFSLKKKKKKKKNVFYLSFRLTKQMRWKNAIHLVPTPKGIHSRWFIIPRESDFKCGGNGEVDKRANKKDRNRNRQKKYIEDTRRKEFKD